MLAVQTRTLPFDRNQTKIRAAALGSTLEEIVDDLFPSFLTEVDCHVTVNGESVPQNLWKSIRPKQNAIVAVNFVPAGGGGGGKNPLATIVSVVTLIAAPQLALAYGASLGAALGTSAVVGSALIKVAVGVTGLLISSALSGAPSQPSVDRRSSVRESPTQFIDGASNAINRFGVIPINLGVNRMFPPQAALPYTETANDAQYSRQLFTWGFGDVEIADEKIGETSLSQFDEVETENKLDSDLSDGTALYSNDVFQLDLNVTLEQPDGFSSRTTELNVDEFSVDITFPQGLVFFDDQGGRGGTTVIVEIRYAPAGTTTWVTSQHSISGRTTSAVRRSFRFIPAVRGQYDVEVRRVTNTTGDQTRDATVWTALRSIKNINPVNQTDISGTAMRIRATDQLNGRVERYNAIVSTKILDYTGTPGVWTTRVSSNPASIYRHVLQSPAFVKRLADARINITQLEAWHDYCEEMGLTYNRVIDYDTNIETVLNDIAAAGLATRNNVDGVYGVVVDNARPIIKGMVTPKNSWGYKGSINYPEIPDALIIEFRNPDAGYALDERIVYNDGFDENTAELYERIEFASCTDADLAYKYGRRYLANIKLQPETHMFYQDPEFFAMDRGDRFTFVHDTILVGVGSARISSVTYDDDITPTFITGFVIDDLVTIPSTAGFAVRIRYTDASSFAYHPLTTVVGETDTFTFTTPIALSEESKLVSALCSFVEDGQELDLLVLSAESDKDYNVKVKAINYAPSRFDLDSEFIPAFESNVTSPLSSYRPVAPVLAAPIQSDESVLLRNSDGSYTSRMVIPLTNNNPDKVEPVIRYRPVGTTQYLRPEVLYATTEEIIITGLEDGERYDIEIRYQKITGSELLSLPLVLNNTLHVGASTAPQDVSNFRISIPNDDVAILSWDRNNDIDLSHYEVRFSPVFTSATWEVAQLLEEFVYENRLPISFRGGTYFIKAVDILGNKSDNATSIITLDPGQIKNVVEELIEDPTFSGTKTNTQVVSSTLRLTDTTLEGTYNFNNSVNLGAITNSFLSAQLDAGALFISDTTDIFAEPDIFAMGDVFGIGGGLTVTTLEARFTDDDPTGSPTWSAWETFSTGFRSFWGAEFRLRMSSLNANVTPVINTLRVTVDMPDRIERGEDLTVPVSGTTVTHSPAFQNNPSIAITIQDGASDDKIEFTSKTSGSFTFRVYNDTSAAYVQRTFDYIASGYGRV